jgi:hypothetical protein
MVLMANAKLQLRASLQRLLPCQPRTVVLAVALLAAGVAARKVWDGMQAELAQSSRYQITSTVIHLTPSHPPAWIRSDVKAEVLRDSGITDSLTLLDPPGVIQQRLIDAFELHPWVRRVSRVDLATPRVIEIDLEYREPIAVAEVTAGDSLELLPVDAEAIRLPDGELTDVEKSYLPRISGIEDRPLVGEAWSDMRMQGAAKLAGELRGVWEAYSLVDIVPSSYPEVQRSHRFYTYEIRTSGGTAIRWGAAPSFAPPGESPFDEKLARLAGYIQQHGPLDSINSPQSIDVRDALTIEKRTVKREELDELVR